MLTRPGSEPGPEWMRRLGGNPRQLRKAILSIIVFVGVIQLAAIVVGDIAVYRADGRHVRLYNSPIQIVGMPLSSMGGRAHGVIAYGGLDRKSTRLNSSHVSISYAVFCLKKKKKC